ncbi:MAG: O-methyltransferase [Bacteroidales bacterium]|jgi:predicted O-methyltransferase YrrM|nr:O-methyltransferase [Bacteroidales bacterium]
MNRTTENYITAHSTAENPVLEELHRQTHIRFVNPNMSSGFIQGRLLEMISRMIKPQHILEIGTFTGYSAICLAMGLQAGGCLTTIEIDDELRDFAHTFFVKAGVDSCIRQITGNALDVIPQLEATFDLVFIDGDKREYSDYYRTVIDRVKSGGFIIADNTLWGGKIADGCTADRQSRGIAEFNNMLIEQTNIENVIIPVRDGLSIIRKK